MFTIPNNALQNVMACRVFRQLRLGILSTTESGTQATGATSFPLSWRPMRTPVATFQTQSESPMDKHGSLDPYGAGSFVGIKVTRDVETAADAHGHTNKYDSETHAF